MRSPLNSVALPGASAVALCVALLAGALAPAARADYAVLRSGVRLHITSYERNGDTVRFHLGGGTVDMPAEQLVRIEPEDVFLGEAASPEPLPQGPYGSAIRAAAQKHGVDEELISSVISAESNFNARAVSPRQALGLMQLIPSTAAQYSVTNAFDPTQNIDGGTHYLKDLLDQYHGDLPRALAAYNAGPQRVEQYHGVPPYAETRAYVQRVTNKFTQSKQHRPRTRAAGPGPCVPELVACPPADSPLKRSR